MSSDAPPAKKLRPKGWNHDIAVQRAAARLVRLHARNIRRGLRNRVPVELGGKEGATR